jgi:hypothetical protein
MVNQDIVKEVKVHNSQIYNGQWDFKIVFPNSSIAYYFITYKELTKEEITNFLVKRMKTYIAYEIYFADDKREFIDLQELTTIKNNLDLRRAQAIVNKYLGYNPQSSIIGV